MIQNQTFRRSLSRRVGVVISTLAMMSSGIVITQVLGSSIAQATDTSQTSLQFSFRDGVMQTWTVPVGVTTATFTLDGAQGGTRTDAGAGGLGAAVVDTVSGLRAGEVIQLNIGGQDGSNGGGAGGLFAGNGGGASDIRVAPYGLDDRLVVAGGGGGGAILFCGSFTCLPTRQASPVGGNSGSNGFSVDAPTRCVVTLTGAQGGSSGTLSGGGAGGAPGGVTGDYGYNNSCDNYALKLPFVLAAGTQAGGDGSQGFGGFGRDLSGGGGGGFYGGGGGGMTSSDNNGDLGSGGSGGGGSSYAPNPASSITEGVNTGDGQIGITYKNPAAPTNIAVTPGDQSAVVSWTNSASNGDDVAYNEVAYSTNGTDWTIASSAILPWETSYTVTGLANRTSYYFEVIALDAVNNSSSALTTLGIWPSTFTPEPSNPAEPTDVTLTGGDRSATVTWTAPIDNGDPAIAVCIEASPNGSTWTSACVGPSSGSFTVEPLINGTSYQFYVFSVDVLSNPSNVVFHDGVTPEPTNPAAPTGIGVIPGVQSAVVTWVNPVSNGDPAAHNKVAYSTNGTDWTVASDTIAATDTRYTVTGLTNQTPYYFEVIALDGSGNPSLALTTVGASPETYTPEPINPAAPTGISVIAGDQSAVVTWVNPPSNGDPTTHNKVAYSTNGTDWTVASDTIAATDTRYTVTGLTNQTAYYFEVIALDALGAPSLADATSVTATAHAPLPLAPTQLTGYAQGSRITLRWNAPRVNGSSPVTSYTVTFSGGSRSYVVRGQTWINRVPRFDPKKYYTVTVRATNATGTGAAAVLRNVKG